MRKNAENMKFGKEAVQMVSGKKENSGFQFPKAIEIVKYKEANGEFIEERPAQRPFGNIILICEYLIDEITEEEPDGKLLMWRLAKRAARDFLRVSFINSAIVTTVKADKPYTSICVYGKY